MRHTININLGWRCKYIEYGTISTAGYATILNRSAGSASLNRMMLVKCSYTRDGGRELPDL